MSEEPTGSGVEPAAGSHASCRVELAALAAEFPTATAERKAEIQSQRHALRAQAAAAGSGEFDAVSLDSLLNLERQLRTRLDDIGSRKLSLGSIGGFGTAGGGLDVLQTMEHNRNLDRSFGAQALLARLLAVREQIAERRT